jgi:NAD(P)-dependent dehydrogenase (short-subunit alcohol dehydrogenase family)
VIAAASSPHPGVAIITGACGGIGRACALRLAANARVLAVDVDPTALEALRAELLADGHEIVVLACDLAENGAADRIIAAACAAGAPTALVHAAGVSPAMADAEKIMAVNYVATRRLAEACGEILRPGFAAVLIASMAAYVVEVADAAAARLKGPLDDDFWLRAASYCPDREASYALSKRGVIELCAHHALTWGPKGARINSISPGIIHTPMATLELAYNGLAMQQMIEACPAGRLGAADEIAAAVQFLCSPDASFVNGVDLLVDGGAVAALRAMSALETSSLPG